MVCAILDCADGRTRSAQCHRDARRARPRIPASRRACRAEQGIWAVARQLRGPVGAVAPAGSLPTAGTGTVTTADTGAAANAPTNPRPPADPLRRRFHAACAPPPLPAPEPKPPIDKTAADDFDSRLQREHAKTGGLAVSLLWNNVNDLDIGIIEPSGEHINLTHRQSKTGDTLDVDMNNTQPSATPVENVYWPEGSVPPRHYKVYVRYLKGNPGAESDQPTAFQIRVKFPDRAEQASGTLKPGDKPVLAREFDVAGGNTGAKK